MGMEASCIVGSALSISRPHIPALKPSIYVPNASGFVPFTSNFRVSKSSSGSLAKVRVGRVTIWRKSFVVRSSTTSDSHESITPVAPLHLESPVGQFLSKILVSHPHLLPAAVDQHLEQLQTDLEAENHKEEQTASGTDLVLYRRIAEVKANERRKTLEEILYTLVVQKFMDANVSLIPSITPSDPSQCVDLWPNEDEKLEKLHSLEATEMIQNHLALILGNRLVESTSVTQISKVRVGQVYAASVTFGYFLKRIDQRFQLEKTMKILPNNEDREQKIIEHHWDDGMPSVGFDASSHHDTQSHPEVTDGAGGISPGGFGYGMKPSRLRNYVMSFDAETLARHAAIRSREAVTIIEKHTEALFGRPEIVITPQGTIDSSRDELIKIGFGGLRRLVLEAITFGTFLWEVETNVDSKCHFVHN